MINLGDTVKDKISGYKGIVIAITAWLHGCKRVTVQSQKLKDGKPLDNFTFDEPQLEVLKTTGPKDPPMRGGGRDDSVALTRN